MPIIDPDCRANNAQAHAASLALAHPPYWQDWEVFRGSGRVSLTALRAQRWRVLWLAFAGTTAACRLTGGLVYWGRNAFGLGSTVPQAMLRGALIALTVLFISLIAGIAVGVFGLRARAMGTLRSGWWIASMCVLALPALLSPLLKPLTGSQAQHRGCGSEHTTQRVSERDFAATGGWRSATFR